MSPRRKKAKLTVGVRVSTARKKHKTEIEEVENNTKRSKPDIGVKDELEDPRRKNFVVACEQVSFKAFLNVRQRLGLIYLPPCAKFACAHDHENNSLIIKPIPSHAEEVFKSEYKINMWYEALEICQLCITPEQYLSANVLKSIAEIIMNAHNDEYSEYSISCLLKKAQQIFAENFSIHSPCADRKLRKCYLTFLTSPMEIREDTFTNRKEFESDQGLVIYCFNRLEYELSMNSKDEPLVNKEENIPEDMRDSVRGLHWQKQSFEIYELLERKDRIERLMLVLKSTIELLEFDIAISYARHNNQLSKFVMKSNVNTLMAKVLWSANPYFTGLCNNTCRKIIRIFAYLIHLKCPQGHINVMTHWLNAMIQITLLNEPKFDNDYPNIGKFCASMAQEIYDIIVVFPQDSIITIIKEIKPNFMQYLVGNLHIQKLVKIEGPCVLTNLLKFIKDSHWKDMTVTNDTWEIPEKLYKYNGNDIIAVYCKNILKISKELQAKEFPADDALYPKYDPEVKCPEEISLNHVVYTFYFTLAAYLNAYSFEDVQKTIIAMNEKIQPSLETEIHPTALGSYKVSVEFIKKYRSLYTAFYELIPVLKDIKQRDDVPDLLKIFENINLIGSFVRN